MSVFDRINRQTLSEERCTRPTDAELLYRDGVISLINDIVDRYPATKQVQSGGREKCVAFEDRANGILEMMTDGRDTSIPVFPGPPR